MTKEQTFEMVIDLLADCNRINGQFPFEHEIDENRSILIIRGHCRQIPRLMFFLEDVLHLQCFLVNDSTLWII